MPAWAALHEDLATLERAAGAPAPPIPDDVTGEDAETIAEMAAILRAGGQARMVRDVRLTFSSDAADFPIGRIVRNFERQGTLVAPLFGEELPVAHEVAATPPMIVRDRRTLPSGETEIRLVPLGAEEVEVMFKVIPIANTDSHHAEQHDSGT